MGEEPKVEDVAPVDAAALVELGAVLMDVREQDEWDLGHAPTAVHLPLAEVAGSAGRFAGQTVLTVCRSGGRSATAAAQLATAGVDVRNVAGGMTAWSADGLPIVRDDGSTGSVG